MAEEKNYKRSSSIFRKKLLDNLNSPDEVDGYIQVTTPSVYVVIATLLMLVVSLFVWGFLGNITDKSSVSGVIFPVEGKRDVSLPNRGTVRSLFVHNGDQVEVGQMLAMVSVENAYSMISAPVAGTVLFIKDENKTFEAFESIVTLIDEQMGSEVYTLVSFVPFEVSRKLQPGMSIEVTPKNLTREKDGYVKGRVTDVAKYPISKEEAIQKMKVTTIATDVFPAEGAAFEVQMEMQQLPEGGLQWSFAPTDSVDMRIGTFCNIQVITKRRSVYQYMFEAVRKQVNSIKMATE